MISNYKKSLQCRVDRHRALFEGNEKGDILVYVNHHPCPELQGILGANLYQKHVERLLDDKGIGSIIEDYVQTMRNHYRNLYAIDDDIVPCATVFWGIGGIVAAMTGLEPTFSPGTSWLEPNLSWKDIDNLRFDPTNKWIQFALQINRELWRCWDEDFFILPFLHRSPLDAANGIRGTEMFLELYTESEKIKHLIDWCADWSIQTENFLHANLPKNKKWGRGSRGTWLPDRAVYINGDPVGMISREMQPEFERSFTEKLFVATGGGYFHNHTMGLYQVDLVAQTKGILLQQFAKDPNYPNLPEVLFNNSKMRDKILQASMLAPILIKNILPQELDRLLPIVKEGRFILNVPCEERNDAASIIRKVRNVSNLK